MYRYDDSSASGHATGLRPRSPLARRWPEPAGDAALVLAVFAVPVVAAAALLARHAGISPLAVPGAALAWGALSLAVLPAVAAGHPHDRFGLANVLTTLRAAIAVLLLAGLADAGRIADAPGFGWALTGVAVLALLLDGVDGLAARATGRASAFGARYDMEVDALFALVLAAIVWRSGDAGLWVLALGAPRYLFVAAGWAFPWLRAPLPPSWRRKAVCVVQIGVLVALTAPPVSGPLAQIAGLSAVAGLVWSFAADIRLLARLRIAA